MNEEQMPAPLFGDKPLPQALDCERAVLSCVLGEAEHTIDLVIHRLPDESCFYTAEHRLIYKAFRAMRDMLEPREIDFVVISDYLDRQGLLSKIGGAEYLSYLLNVVPIASNLETYLDAAYEAWVLRRLISECTKISRSCFEPQEDIVGFMNDVESRIQDVSAARTDKPAVPMNELMHDAVEHLEQLTKGSSDARGYPTGYDLDFKINGLRRGELIVLAARPSIGKTALAMNIARNVAGDGKGVIFFSLEMGAAQVAVRMLCSEARVNIRDIRDGRLTNAQWAGTIMDAGDRLSKLPIFIDETPQLSAIEMRQKARRIAQDHEVNCIVIDYLQLMRATGVSRNANREQEVSKLSSDIKAMAKDMDVPVLLLAQLNRQAEQGGRPKLSQLRESGAIEQDADVVMLLHRDRDQAIEHEDGDEPTGLESEVIIAKNRNGETGIVKLMFIGQYTRFENATRIADEDVPLD